MFKRLSVLPNITKRLASTFTYIPKGHYFPVPVLPQLHQALSDCHSQRLLQQQKQLDLTNMSNSPSFSILDQLPEKKYIDETRSDGGSLGVRELYLTSVLRKRRLKMKKHKLRKRRKAQRALKIRLNK